MPYPRICLRDPDAFLERQRACKRPLKSGSSPVEIPETPLPISGEDLWKSSFNAVYTEDEVSTGLSPCLLLPAEGC